MLQGAQAGVGLAFNATLPGSGLFGGVVGDAQTSAKTGAETDNNSASGRARRAQGLVAGQLGQLGPIPDALLGSSGSLGLAWNGGRGTSPTSQIKNANVGQIRHRGQESPLRDQSPLRGLSPLRFQSPLGDAPLDESTLFNMAQWPPQQVIIPVECGCPVGSRCAFSSWLGLRLCVHACRQTDRQTDRHTYTQSYCRRTDEQAGRQAGRQAVA